MTDAQNIRPQDDLLWRHLKTLPAFRAILRAVEARFYHQIPLQEPILDLGCGDGNFAELTFNEYGRQLTVGLDPWWGPLNKSKRGEIYVDGVTQALGDRMPFPSDYFASAMSNSVLEHIPDIQPVLNETARVLQIGGRFVITMPNHRFTECLAGAQLFEKVGLNPLADQYRTAFNFISRHAHTESVEWWGQRLATAGLQIERWQYYFSPKALHALEVGHAQGLPAAIIHAFTNQWVIAPTEANLRPVDRWLRPFYLEQAEQDDEQNQGTYLLIVARKVAHHAVQPDIPEARPFKVGRDGTLQPEEDYPNVVLPAEPTPINPVTETEAELQDTAERLHDIFAEELASTPAFSGTTLKDMNWISVLTFVAGLMCSYLAYSVTSTTSRPIGALTLWIIGIGLAAASLWPQDTPLSWKSFKPSTINWQEASWPIGLFFAAAILRLVQLNDHPFILSGTEALLASDGLRAIAGGIISPFDIGALTNPILPFYLTGLSTTILGRTPFALRLVPALIGALTVPALYVIAKRVWNRETAVAAAIMLTGTHVHLHYSRLGLSNVWDGLVALLIFATLQLAWSREWPPSQEKGGLPFAWLGFGLAVGVSAYFFTVSHLLPFFALIFLLVQLPFDLRGLQINGRKLLFSLALAIVVALPMLRFYNNNEGIFMARANDYGIFQTEWIIDESVRTNVSPNAILIDQLQKTITGFTHTADASIYYNSGRAVFGLALATLWVIGLLWALYHFTELRYRLLFAWHTTAIIFAGVLLLDPPSSHRLVFLLPLACLVAAVPLGLLFRLFAESLVLMKRNTLRFAMLILLTAAFVAPETTYYFRDYRQEGRFADRNTEIAHELGRYLAEQPKETTAYFYGAPIVYTSFPTLSYLAPAFTPNANFFDITENQLRGDINEQAGPYLFIFLPERQGDLQLVAETFPNGQLEAINGRYASPLFTVYAVDTP